MKIVIIIFVLLILIFALVGIIWNEKTPSSKFQTDIKDEYEEEEANDNDTKKVYYD